MSNDSDHGVSRRDLLKRGAVVGGTLVWAVPAVQSVSGVALAATKGSVDPEKHHRPPTKVEGEKHELPFTGASINPVETAAVGAGLAIAGGAAVEVARRRRRAAAEGPVEDTID